MFFNSEITNEVKDQQIQNSQSSSKIQQKGRSNNMNRFQVKKKDEPKQDNQSLSRIQQREIEIQRKQAESQNRDDNDMVESLVQFDSENEQNGSNQIINPLILNQQEFEEQNKQQHVIQSKPKTFNQISTLQNNVQYKKKLGENESSYDQEFDFNWNQLTIIGNNHNQYFEPGQQLVQNNDLPQLSKQNNKNNFDYIKKNQENENQQSKDEDQNLKGLSEYQELDYQIDRYNDILSRDSCQSDNCIQNTDENKDDSNHIISQNIQNEEEKQENKVIEENTSKQIVEEQLPQQQVEQQQQQEQIIQQNQTCPYPKPIASISMPYGKKHFLLNPAQKGGMIQCTIKRDRSGMCRFYPKYHMHFSNGFLYLMSAKKRACNNTSNYIISQSRDDMEKSDNFLGKVRSNFMGTEFILYDSGLNPEKTKDPQKFRQQLGVVQYESNLLGAKGPRKMVVLLPNLNDRDQLYEFKPSNSKDGMIKEYINNNRDQIVTYVNRPPQWNSRHKAFVLNFYQRVDKPSVKNFQLIVDKKEDNILLQFGRVGEDLFNLDFQYPITPLQAFQIALTSFDYKIACE
ncbi:unnamed protein product [Paramecium primaurelia]|uniref:Tubby C-terminal domain-containing protein n=1 Tax=Paramecium primaurelia TaxID=5886 RepID=A0A8S1KVK5_PARPR|nr:unnamed protein product [Paramecium primaurelia]